MRPTKTKKKIETDLNPKSKFGIFVIWFKAFRIQIIGHFVTGGNISSLSIHFALIETSATPKTLSFSKFILQVESLKVVKSDFYLKSGKKKKINKLWTPNYVSIVGRVNIWWQSLLITWLPLKVCKNGESIHTRMYECLYKREFVS